MKEKTTVYRGWIIFFSVIVLLGVLLLVYALAFGQSVKWLPRWNLFI